MIRTKLFLACALASVVTLSATSAAAQMMPTNQITYFTFSAPFELPGGKTLPAGKYVFKIADSLSNRHVVHIMSEDQTTMHATVMAIPAQRVEPAEEPEVRFMEAEANMAPAVRTWWYPGRVIGHEFIYPKDQARRLAARQSEGVLTTAGDATGDDAMRSGDLARIGADGREAEYRAETTTADSAAQPAQTTPAPAQTEQAAPVPAPDAAADTRTAEAPRAPASDANAMSERNAVAERADRDATAARTELPRTATVLPLIGLLGLGSLLGAGALRLRR